MEILNDIIINYKSQSLKPSYIIQESEKYTFSATFKDTLQLCLLNPNFQNICLE